MSLSIWLRVDPCPHCGRADEGPSMNITHNVSPMWRLVGVYDALYESDGKVAGEFVPALRRGVETMRERIEECRALNPPNGWGDADGALRWLEKWLAASEKHPTATIEVSR